MILALLIRWLSVTDDCLGRPLRFPEQITYAVPYRVREMVFDPSCPLDMDGNQQTCAIYTGSGEWVTPTTSLDVSGTAAPPVGVVFDVQEPIAVTPLHRSDEGCF